MRNNTTLSVSHRFTLIRNWPERTHATLEHWKHIQTQIGSSVQWIWGGFGNLPTVNSRPKSRRIVVGDACRTHTTFVANIVRIRKCIHFRNSQQQHTQRWAMRSAHKTQGSCLRAASKQNHTKDREIWCVMIHYIFCSDSRRRFLGKSGITRALTGCTHTRKCQ